MWIKRKELERRLGSAYANGYADGFRGTPFLAGYWLGQESREVANETVREIQKAVEAERRAAGQSTPIRLRPKKYR